jgi:hypothetical protein
MTRRLGVALLALAAAAGVGCGKKKTQSFKQGVEELCNGVDEVPASMPPALRLGQAQKRLDTRVTNPEARKLVEQLETGGGIEPIRAAAAQAGLDHCSLVDAAGGGAAAAPAGQSLADGLRLICEAPDRVKLDPAASQSDRATAIASYIQQNLHNPEALSLMQEMAAMAADQKGPYLAETARKNGVARCPLAEMK